MAFERIHDGESELHSLKPRNGAAKAWVGSDSQLAAPLYVAVAGSAANIGKETVFIDSTEKVIVFPQRE